MSVAHQRCFCCRLSLLLAYLVEADAFSEWWTLRRLLLAMWSFASRHGLRFCTTKHSTGKQLGRDESFRGFGGDGDVSPGGYLVPAANFGDGTVEISLVCEVVANIYLFCRCPRERERVCVCVCV